jgi:hypothetical protein
VFDAAHWNINAQYIRTCKPIVDAIGNLESQDATLANCVIELLKCACKINGLNIEDTDNMDFALHATTTFNNKFHELITDHHLLALFLHPLAQNLALSQHVHARNFADICRIAMALAHRWGWNQGAAKKLLDHLQQYRANQGIFEGGLSNAEQWWKHQPVTAEQCPLKAMALIMHAIVPHSAELERLFSDLGKTQGDSQSNLDVTTICSLGRLHQYSCHLTDASVASEKLTSVSQSSVHQTQGEADAIHH